MKLNKAAAVVVPFLRNADSAAMLAITKKRENYVAEERTAEATWGVDISTYGNTRLSFLSEAVEGGRRSELLGLLSPASYPQYSRPLLILRQT